ARILNHLYNLVWVQADAMYKDYDMTLTNNSYAAFVADCNIAGTYDIYSQELDNYAFQFPHVLNVFAAGNDGNKTCNPYPPGYGTVVGVYQSSKNTLTIGGVEKDLHTPYGSTSKGPTKDGRIKPELVTIG